MRSYYDQFGLNANMTIDELQTCLESKRLQLMKRKLLVDIGEVEKKAIDRLLAANKEAKAVFIRQDTKNQYDHLIEHYQGTSQSLTTEKPIGPIPKRAEAPKGYHQAHRCSTKALTQPPGQKVSSQNETAPVNVNEKVAKNPLVGKVKAYKVHLITLLVHVVIVSVIWRFGNVYWSDYVTRIYQVHSSDLELEYLFKYLAYHMPLVVAFYAVDFFAKAGYVLVFPFYSIVLFSLVMGANVYNYFAMIGRAPVSTAVASVVIYLLGSHFLLYVIFIVFALVASMVSGVVKDLKGE